MQHKCKVTVIDKKVYPQLQQQYCMDKNSGPCPCYQIGDVFVFERYGTADDFWHMGLNTVKQSGASLDETAGGPVWPHCSEAWDAISRYVYAALQGGSIMRGWMEDERVMIACCSDGTRPVIFKIQRLDYKALYIEGISCDACRRKISEALMEFPQVTDVSFQQDFTEVFLDGDVGDDLLKEKIASLGGYTVSRID